MKTLKIVMVDPMCQGPFYNQYLCSQLAEGGMDVTLFTREPDFIKGYFDNRKFQVRRLNRFTRKLFPDQSFIGKTAKYLELILVDVVKLFFAGAQSDVVHVQWFSPFPFSHIELACYRLLKSLGVKIVFTAHNVYPHESDMKEYGHLRRIFSAFPAIIALTQYSKKILEQDFSIPSPNISVIPLGPFFHDKEKLPLKQAKARLSIPEMKQVILFLGILKPYKGIEFLLETFSQFVKQSPESILLIAGSGKESYKTELRAMIASLSIPEKNIITKFGFLTNEEMVLYYSAADVAVFPYKHIYQSGAMFTAMGLGKAIIATNVGGFSEVVEDNVTGKLIDYGDKDGFISTLKEMLSSEEMRERFAANVRKKMLGEYSWETIAKQTVETYLK